MKYNQNEKYINKQFKAIKIGANSIKLINWKRRKTNNYAGIEAYVSSILYPHLVRNEAVNNVH